MRPKKTYWLPVFCLAVFWACGSQSTPSVAALPNGEQNPAEPSDGNAFTGKTIVRQGRFADNGGNMQTNWAGASIKVRARGQQVILRAQSVNTANYNQTLDVIVDGSVQTPPIVIKSSNNASGYPLTLPDTTKAHVVEWRLRTEANYSNNALTLATVDVVGGELLPTPTPSTKQMEFIGDSITNGYGVLGNIAMQCSQRGDAENNELAYGPLTAEKLKADYRIIASSGRGVFRNLDKVQNSPPNASPTTVRAMFGMTLHPYISTPPTASAAEIAAAGTYSASSDGWAPSVVVINLGTNDFSRRSDSADNTSAIPDASGFVSAYAGLIADVLVQYPQAAIVPCLGPMLSDVMTIVADNGSGQLTQQSGQTDTTTKPLTNARTFIQQAIAAARQAAPAAKISDLVEFATQDVTTSACDAHPNAQVHAQMAVQLHSAIVGLGIAGFTD